MTAASAKIEAPLDFSESTADLVRALRSFSGALDRPEAEEQAQQILSHALMQADRLRLDRSAVAQVCQVTEATISRWGSGTVRPHPLIARVAIGAMRRLALEKAAEYEKASQDRARV